MIINLLRKPKFVYILIIKQQNLKIMFNILAVTQMPQFYFHTQDIQNMIGPQNYDTIILFSVFT